MIRLPIPGKDNGTWGEILNSYLAVEHNADGTLKKSDLINAKADDTSVVHKSGDEQITGIKTFTGRIQGLLHDKGAQVFDVANYCTTLDADTDNTSGLNACITAAMQAGGQVFISGYCRADGPVVIPNNGATHLPTQKPLRIFGAGGTWQGYWTGVAPAMGASVLDLRYNGSGSQIAKIDTRGSGLLEIDHLTLYSGGSDDCLFISTTNTTVFIHHNAVLGNRAKNGVNCLQDFIRLGGDGSSTSQENGPNAIFQGYGSKLCNNFYDKIQRPIIFGAQCNNIEIQNETISKTCGSSLADGAPFYFMGAGVAGGANGVVIRSGTIEVTNYKYCLRLEKTRGCLFDAIGIYDDTGYTVAGCYADTNSFGNLCIRGWGALAFFDGPGASNNTLLSATYFHTSNFPRGLIVGNGDGVGLQAATITGATTIKRATTALPNGGNMTIDTGTGGSFLDTVQYSLRLKNQSGTTMAEIMPGKAKGAIRPGADTTANRPSASTAGAGSIFFDTTLNKLLVSNGTGWEVITSS